jgi:hypothetical protein
MRTVYREVWGEALTGERAGQPLSHEIFLIQDADVVTYAEAKRTGATTRLPERSCVVGDPGMHERSLLDNREISSLAICSQGVVRVREGEEPVACSFDFYLAQIFTFNVFSTDPAGV